MLDCWLALWTSDRTSLAACATIKQTSRLCVSIRIYCLQQWFNLSELRIGEAFYESKTRRNFIERLRYGA